MTGSDIATVAGLDVSRETLDALRAFDSLVQRWNPAINLVSKASLRHLWQRHILDSAQVFSLCPTEALSWVDLGSGGGFPGIVVAILARELKPALRVGLVESDQRKATFLRQACQSLDLSATVVSKRIEALEPLNADVISARALAPLTILIGFAEQHVAQNGVAIFPKGARFADEISEARSVWSFDVDIKQSLSEAEAAILVIRNIHRAHD
jgi:16S rRNA (guanine527-N7)-methyltransferase